MTQLQTAPTTLAEYTLELKQYVVKLHSEKT